MLDIRVNHLINNTEISKLDYKDNTLVYSKLTSFYKPIKAEGVSIKYVMAGEEHYYLNKKRFSIRGNECFISNQPLEGNTHIDSKTEVRGACLNISFNLIKEIEASLADTKYFEGASFFSDSILKEDVFEVFQLNSNNLSQKIASLKAAKYSHPYEIGLRYDSLFFDIGEALVLDQAPKLRYLQKIQTVKSETKREILKRLLWAKEHIDAFYFQDLQVKDLARIATMSEFHFSRMFKMVFGYSPYQYQIKLRMEKAKFGIENKDMMIQEIAQEVGYADIYVFSKAFKKFYGAFPSSYKIK